MLFSCNREYYNWEYWNYRVKQPIVEYFWFHEIKTIDFQIAINVYLIEEFMYLLAVLPYINFQNVPDKT